MRIGSLRHTNAEWYSYLPLKWSDGPIVILGSKIYPNLEQTIENNYNNALQKVQNILNIWKSRDFSLVGKVHIISSLAVSQFLYHLQVLPSPQKDTYNAYNKIIKSFLWGEGRTKIAPSRLSQEHDRLGLKLTDLELKDKALKLAR